MDWENGLEPAAKSAYTLHGVATDVLRLAELQRECGFFPAEDAASSVSVADTLERYAAALFQDSQWHRNMVVSALTQSANFASLTGVSLSDDVDRGWIVDLVSRDIKSTPSEFLDNVRVGLSESVEVFARVTNSVGEAAAAAESFLERLYQVDAARSMSIGTRTAESGLVDLLRTLRTAAAAG